MTDTTAKNRIERIKVVPDSGWTKRKGGSEYDRFILFYNEDGKLIKQINTCSYDGISLPPSSREFIAFFRGNPGKCGELNKKPYVALYDKNGNKINEVELKSDYSGRVFCSDNKSFAHLGSKSSNTFNKYFISFYDSNGLCIKDEQPATDYEYDNICAVTYWKGQYFITLISESWAAKTNMLCVYDVETGSIVKKKKLNGIEVAVVNDNLIPDYTTNVLLLKTYGKTLHRKTLEINLEGNVVGAKDGW